MRLIHVKCGGMKSAKGGVEKERDGLKAIADIIIEVKSSSYLWQQMLLCSLGTFLIYIRMGRNI